MNFLLTKIFGFRDKVASETMGAEKEMPFLDHLEELRICIFRILITALVSMILCFVFSPYLMDLIKYPVKKANLGLEVGDHLPAELTEKEWLQIKDYSEAAVGLSSEQRKAFISLLFPDKPQYRPFVESLHLYKAAIALPEESRSPFIETATQGDTPLSETVSNLVSAAPKGELTKKNNLMVMSALKPAEPFTLAMKLALYAGIILSFPLLLYFLAQFIFPGLTAKEKKTIMPALGVGTALFLIGVVFAFFVVTPRALQFFTYFGEKHGISPDWRIGYYIGFVTQLLLVFGLSFELPVVVMAMVKMSLLSSTFMRETRAYAIVIIFIFAAVISPTTDIPTMLMLAGPMIFNYELCIWLAVLLDRKRKKIEAEEEAEYALWQEKKRKEAAEQAAKAADREKPIVKPLTSPDDPSRFEYREENDAYYNPYEENLHGDRREDDARDEYEEGFEPKAEQEDSEDGEADAPEKSSDLTDTPGNSGEKEASAEEKVDDTEDSSQDGKSDRSEKDET